VNTLKSGQINRGVVIQIKRARARKVTVQSLAGGEERGSHKWQLEMGKVGPGEYCVSGRNATAFRSCRQRVPRRNCRVQRHIHHTRKQCSFSKKQKDSNQACTWSDNVDKMGACPCGSLFLATEIAKHEEAMFSPSILRPLHP